MSTTTYQVVCVAMTDDAGWDCIVHTPDESSFPRAVMLSELASFTAYHGQDADFVRAVAMKALGDVHPERLNGPILGDRIVFDSMGCTVVEIDCEDSATRIPNPYREGDWEVIEVDILREKQTPVAIELSRDKAISEMVGLVQMFGHLPGGTVECSITDNDGTPMISPKVGGTHYIMRHNPPTRKN